MQQANRLKKQKRSNQGFTLIEMLITTLIMGLVTVMIASSIQSAFQVYTRATQASEAQVLCDTLVTAVQDELRYATDVKDDGLGSHAFTYTSRSKGYGSNCALEVRGDRLVVQKIGRSPNELIPDSAYNNGLGVSDTATTFTLDVDGSGNPTGKIQVKLVVVDQDGHELASQEFAVKPLNGVE